METGRKTVINIVPENSDIQAPDLIAKKLIIDKLIIEKPGILSLFTKYSTNHSGGTPVLATGTLPVMDVAAKSAV